MKTFKLFVTCALSLSLCLTGFAFPDSAQQVASYRFSSRRPVIEKDDKFVEDEVIVVTDVSADEESLQMAGISKDVSLLMSDAESETYRISLCDEIDVERALDAYVEIPAVLYAQPNYQIEQDGMLLGSEQTSGVRQWQHEVLHTKEAWELMDRVPGRQCVKVAVIEGAVDINHPDLKENIDTENSCSLANGYKEAITTVAANDHSTHVAGIIAAVSDNNIGTEGIACGTNNDCVKIVSVNVYKNGSDAGGSVTADVIISALQYAVTCGCRVINMSFGVGYIKNQAIENAVTSAFNSGAVVVCAAPNNHSTQYAVPSDVEQSISVIDLAYSGNGLSRQPDSDYGEYKDISAPGTSIYSTKTGGTYGYYTGTSMAAPMVSGVAALVCSTNPGLTSAQVRRLLIWTARDLGASGWDNDTAAGCVDAYQAVYIALWMKDSTLLPDEKLTFSNEIAPLPKTLEDIFVTDKFKPLLYFFCDSNLSCGSPLALTTENLEKYVVPLESGELTACEFFDELRSKSTLTLDSSHDYLMFVYDLFLHRKPTLQEAQAGYYLLLEANGRNALADQLLHSDEFILRCKNSYVTAGDGLTEFK